MDRDTEGVSGQGDEYSTEKPDVEAECSASEQERKEVDIECEFEVKNGSWWCNTHNCWA